MKLITILFSILLAQVIFAQEITHTCGFDHHLQNLYQTYPEYRSEMNDWYRMSRENGPTGHREVLNIPVVFHVVHNTDSQNLPDSVLYSQLEILNEDYRRLNADAINTREEFQPFAGDAEIEFHLADTDPFGNPSTGITHTFTERSGFDFDFLSIENTLDEVKSSETGGVDPWPTDHFLNIWICNIEASIFGQIFGIAYPPQGAPNWPDGSAEPSPQVSGVIVHYTTVGRNNPVATDDDFDGNDFGRTVTHEIGHYFGLRHIWGDAFFLGCNEDDGISDTPNASTAANYTCTFDSNTCVDEPIDYPDMVENFMDYNQGNCVNLFTQEQVDVMRWVIENLRPGLLEDFVSVDEHRSDIVQNIYPNPTSGILNLNLRRKSGIVIYDALGRAVMNADFEAGTQDLDLQHLQNGIYFLRDDSNSAALKFLMHK